MANLFRKSLTNALLYDPVCSLTQGWGGMCWPMSTAHEMVALIYVHLPVYCKPSLNYT